jgi:FkbM family methyltransferase
MLKRLPPGLVCRLPSHVINRHSYLYGLYSPRITSFHSKIVLQRADDSTAIDLDTRGIASHGGETLDLFAKLLPRAGTILDIGSHTGIYSVMAGVQDRSRSVYAFEPVPQIFDRLQSNIALNRAQNVRALPYAVSDHDGNLRLFIPKGKFPTEASTLSGFRETAESIAVQGVTVDSFAATHQVGTIDLMKIDTEATEHKVVRGARHCLERDMPVIICEVLHGLTEPALHAALDHHGYLYFMITHDGLIRMQRIEGDPSYTYLNYLMIPEQKAPRMLDGLRVL